MAIHAYSGAGICYIYYLKTETPAILIYLVTTRFQL